MTPFYMVISFKYIIFKDVKEQARKEVEEKTKADFASLGRKGHI